jgi:hypothetical protein
MQCCREEGKAGHPVVGRDVAETGRQGGHRYGWAYFLVIAIEVK